MKLIKLTQGKFAKVDDWNYNWLNQYKWYAQKDINGLTWYAIRNAPTINNKRGSIRMHRVILGLTDPLDLGDHINHDGLDNQEHNIRPSTIRENSYNRTSYGKSKYLGVSIFNVKRNSNSYVYWRARIVVNNKSIFLGQTKNEKLAAELYNKAAKQYFGEFANLNII